MKGVFITIYGINNVGKSTQINLLDNYLSYKKNYRVKFIKYPVYYLEPTGPKINKILRGSGPQKITEDELQQLFYQNRKDFEPELKKLLDEGTIVIAEDYAGTGIAWGTAKGANQEWLESLNKDLIQPDLSILLTGKRHLMAKETGHLHEENHELVDKVSKTLVYLANKYGWTSVETGNTPYNTFVRISEIVEKKIDPNLVSKRF